MEELKITRVKRIRGFDPFYHGISVKRKSIDVVSKFVVSEFGVGAFRSAALSGFIKIFWNGRLVDSKVVSLDSPHLSPDTLNVTDAIHFACFDMFIEERKLVMELPKLSSVIYVHEYQIVSGGKAWTK